MTNILYYIKYGYYLFCGKTDNIINLRINKARSLGVKIGENMRCFSNLISAEPFLLEFGDNITVSSGVKFITHDNSVCKIIPGVTDALGKIKVGNNCFIGLNSILLPGIEIGDNTIIAAGSVVTKSYEGGNIVIGGNPAKIICTIDEYKEKIKNKTFNTKNLNNKEIIKLISKNNEKLLKK